MRNPYQLGRLLGMVGLGGPLVALFRRSIEKLGAKIDRNKATIVIFLPTLLYMALFFLYAVSIWDFYHGFMGLALLTFLPCFFGCYFILPVVGLVQLVFGICSLFIKNGEGPQHILSAIATLLLTACFFLFLMAGNVVTV